MRRLRGAALGFCTLCLCASESRAFLFQGPLRLAGIRGQASQSTSTSSPPSTATGGAIVGRQQQHRRWSLREDSQEVHDLLTTTRQQQPVMGEMGLDRSFDAFRKASEGISGKSLREEIQSKLLSLFTTVNNGEAPPADLLTGGSMGKYKGARESLGPLTGMDTAEMSKVPEPVNENIARIGERIPNAWLAVCHSDDLGPKGLKKIVVDDKPICLFRIPSGEVRAISDICLHRAAALSDGWLDGDMVVCPYHAYKFDGEGKLRYIPGVDENLLAKNKRTARTVWYKTLEQAGLIYIFPDAMRAGAIEQHVKPFLLPEAVDPTFRGVEGTAEIGASANLVVENLLDMLHISYVHTFGNMQEPLPFSETYDVMYDDEGSNLLPYARTTFRYKSGSKSISKVVGKINEVVVENEFHIPYTTVTRVRFGNDIKTVYVVAVPIREGRTLVHYKLYRNFMYVHPRDQSFLNKAYDMFFQSVMTLTLNEDKTILESLYAEHQRGYVLSRYDKALKLYRRTIKEYMEATKAREEIAERRTLEMELLRLIENTERGRKATRGQHTTILQIVSELEKGFQRQFANGNDDFPVIEDSAVNGSWHLVYANPGNLSAVPAMAAPKAARVPSSFPTQKETDDVLLHGAESGKVQNRLRSAGAERYLLDFKATGRPIWADTEESMQMIDTSKSLLSNTAVYQGLLGIRTTVELNGYFNKVGPNRKDVRFKTAQVDFGGFKVVFPHMDLFGVSGWLETTFVDEHIRICRGNRGSLFVLTRRPLAPAA